MSNKNNTENLDIDEVINKLLEVRGSHPGKHVNLEYSEIKNIVMKSREIFMSQPPLLELAAPIKICGGKCDTLFESAPKVN